VTCLPPIELDTVRIPIRTDLELVAKLAGTSYENIRELNPDLHHRSTPPNYSDFQLKIPKGIRGHFEAEYAPRFARICVLPKSGFSQSSN
jgi:membrane-bound lytic murein transglycosylase D